MIERSVRPFIAECGLGSKRQEKKKTGPDRHLMRSYVKKKKKKKRRYFIQRQWRCRDNISEGTEMETEIRSQPKVQTKICAATEACVQTE